MERNEDKGAPEQIVSVIGAAVLPKGVSEDLPSVVSLFRKDSQKHKKRESERKKERKKEKEAISRESDKSI